MKKTVAQRKETTIKHLQILYDGWSKEDFDPNMVNLGGINEIEYSVVESKPKGNVCGTDCCLLGKSPDYIPYKKSDFDGWFYNKNVKIFSYGLYVNRVYPYLNDANYLGTKYLFEFIFSGNHFSNKNLCLERVKYLIDKNMEVSYKECVDFLSHQIRNYVDVISKEKNETYSFCLDEVLNDTSGNYRDLTVTDGEFLMDYITNDVLF